MTHIIHVVSGAGEMAQQLQAMAVESKGPRFNFQDPHGDSQPSVTKVPGDPMSLLAFVGTRHTQGTYIHPDIALIHIK